MTAPDAARPAGLVGGATSRLKEDGAPDGRLLRRTLEELVEDATGRPTRAAVALVPSTMRRLRCGEILERRSRGRDDGR